MSDNRTKGGLKSRIFVCVRLRPLVSVDIVNGNNRPSGCIYLNPNGQTVKLIKDRYNEKEFYFDRTFNNLEDQQSVYKDSFRYLVKDFVDGFNCTGLMYGQTGSGKTFTMFGQTGDPSCPGLIDLALADLYSVVRQRESKKLFTSIAMSFFQIHVDNVYDLLRSLGDLSAPTPLSIREDGKCGTYVEGLNVIDAADLESMMHLIAAGLANRHNRSTKFNVSSSRSHAILQIFLSCNEKDVAINPGGAEHRHKHALALRRGRTLTLVDLAGSERVQNYGVKMSKEQTSEAVEINRSIACLGNCVQALVAIHTSKTTQDGGGGANTSTHVPFRDCKLTRLLSVSLSGNAKMCIIATVGPCMFNYEETYSTLKFASRYCV
jgi:hypothetical protein